MIKIFRNIAMKKFDSIENKNLPRHYIGNFRKFKIAKNDVWVKFNKTVNQTVKNNV